MPRTTPPTALAIIASALAVLLTPALAQADTGVIEVDGVEANTPEHVLVTLASNTVDFETPSGDWTCDIVDGELSIDEAHVDGATEVGTIDSLDFTHSVGGQFCPTDIPGVSGCDPTIATPIHVTLDPNNPGPVLLLLDDQEVEWDCNTIVGSISCHYTAATITGEISGNQVTFGNDDHLTLTTGSFLCPAEWSLETTLALNDEDDNPVTYESTK